MYKSVELLLKKILGASEDPLMHSKMFWGPCIVGLSKSFRKLKSNYLFQ